MKCVLCGIREWSPGLKICDACLQKYTQEINEFFEKTINECAEKVLREAKEKIQHEPKSDKSV